MTGPKTNELPGTRAQVRYVRVPAYEAGEVLNGICGLPVADAADYLDLCERGVAEVISGCLNSAVANAEHELVKIGKAGRNRWKGKRPQTRGVAMNPVDHPHGGGEGKTSGGRHPVSPWGKPESRTRNRKKESQKLIVRRRRTRGSRR